MTALSGWLDMADVSFFAKLKLRQTFRPRLSFEFRALRSSNNRIPRKRLKFRLTHEGLLDKFMELTPTDLTLSRVQRRNGIQHLHGTQDRYVQALSLFAGEIGRMFSQLFFLPAAHRKI